jgi:hypothetical protein
MTSWPPKTRYKKSWGAPTLTQAALHRAQTKGLGWISRISDVSIIHTVFKRFNQKNPRSMQIMTVWPSLTNTKEMLQWWSLRNEFRLQNHRPPNKRYVNLDNDVIDPFKRTDGHTGAYTTKITGVTRSGCTHTNIYGMTYSLPSCSRLVFTNSTGWRFYTH